METRDYLKILKNEIHSSVMATVDENGLPVTRVIDVMLVDDNTLYFLTAKGKEFYKQLMNQKYVSISGICGGEGMDKKEASVHMKALSIRGTVENIGSDLLDEIFEVNPYMKDIYPDASARTALEVFKMKAGQGEYFDLSTKPITRGSFSVGEEETKAVEKGGYFITDRCHGCRICYSKCPQRCIDMSQKPFVIQQEHCLHCGTCISVCPFGAIEKR